MHATWNRLVCVTSLTLLWAWRKCNMHATWNRLVCVTSLRRLWAWRKCNMHATWTRLVCVTSLRLLWAWSNMHATWNRLVCVTSLLIGFFVSFAIRFLVACSCSAPWSNDHNCGSDACSSIRSSVLESEKGKNACASKLCQVSQTASLTQSKT